MRARIKRWENFFLLSFIICRFAIPAEADPFSQLSRRETKLWTFLFSLGVAYSSDNRVRTLVQKNRTGGTDDLSRIVGNLGRGEVLFPLTGALYCYGKKMGKERLVRASRNALKNMLIAGGITVGTKWATGRARPLEKMGARHFRPFSNKDSFPSGDTAMAFAVASAYAREYPHEVKALGYGLAVLVAYSRLNKDAHWASDTLTSAFLSTEVARWVHHHKKFPLLSFTDKTFFLTWTR